MIDFARSVSADNIAPLPAPAIPSPSRQESATREPAPRQPFPCPDLVRLGDEIAELAAHIHAATYRLLVLIREFDKRGGWHTGFKSCAHWLSWRTGIAHGPAREKVRVARALEQLPLLSGMMQSGELSYSKARALTRVATPENEEQLMDFARHGTASHVESLVRGWRRVDRLEEQWQERERHRNRSLTIFPDGDGMYVIRGRLDPEVGAVLMRAMEAARDALYGRSTRRGTTASCEGSDSTWRKATEVETEPTTGPQKRADAIGLLAERALQSGLGDSGRAGGESCEESGEESGEESEQEGREEAAILEPRTIGRADRFQVVVHVDADALLETSERGDSMLEDGVRVPAGTSRRFACDASRVLMTHGSDGSVLDVGRRTRTVPPAIRRALDHRDGGCRFPGCGNRFCDAHHIKHWADGGETRLDNLVLLCRRHHRAVHEEGFSVEMVRDERGPTVAHGGSNTSAHGGTVRRGVRFRWPDGRPFPDVPPVPRLSDDPVVALQAKHSMLGIHVDPETTTPHWNGERFDVGWAIYTMLSQ